jgi:hypothetical protein
MDGIIDSNSGINIASGSRNKAKGNLPTSESDIRFQFLHPAPVYGCAWSCTHAPIIATCCQDGYTLKICMINFYLNSLKKKHSNI